LSRGGFIGLPVLEHVVNDTGDFMGGGDGGRFGAEGSAFAAVVGAKGRLTFGAGLSGLAEGLAGAVVVFEGAGSEDLAAGDIVMGGQAEPGAEVFDGGELVHIGAGFGGDGLGDGLTDAIDGDEVDAGEAEEVGADVEVGLVLGIGFFLGGGQVGQSIRAVPAGLAGTVGALEGLVTGGDLGRVGVVERESLLDDEDIFGLPVAGEGGGDGGFIPFTAGFAESGEGGGVAFAGDDGAEDVLAGDAHDIGEDMMDLDVHALEGALDVEDMRGAMLDELSAVAEISAEGTHFGIRAKGSGEEAEAV